MNTIVEELNLRLESVERQRNRALADHAIAEGKLGLAEQRIAVLVKKVDELEKKLPKTGAQDA